MRKKTPQELAEIKRRQLSLKIMVSSARLELKAVAERAKLTPGTVSNALNRPKLSNIQILGKIEKAILSLIADKEAEAETVKLSN